MCCQLQEQSVWEQMEGGKQGGELLFWGHSMGKVPCNTAGPKAQWPIFTELCPVPREQTSSLFCPDFTKTRRLPALTVHWEELVQNRFPEFMLLPETKLGAKVISSVFAQCCPSQSPAPAASLMPSSSSPVAPQQAGDVTGHGLPSAEIMTELTCLAHQCGAFPCTHSNFHEEM